MMVDFLSEEERSHRMSLIRGKDTKHELLLRKALWWKGMRYRKHYGLPGKPDIVFPRKKVAIFCDGCFWHKCPKHYKPPQSRKEYWKRKIKRNKARDRVVTKSLRDEGWTVARFWECDIKKDVEKVVKKIENILKS
jgi:DNA mismatch endonuclease (patch repair protein)